MNNLPLVSIITSTYNQAEFLEKAIESVITQDYPKIEYLVFNDGSTDGTEEVLRKYNGKIHWENQSNMKETPTLNKALKIARGEIIGKLSSDDYYYPGLVTETVQSFLDHKDIIVSYPDFDVVNKNEKIIYTSSTKYDFPKSVSEHLCIPGVGAFFHRRLLNNVTGFDTTFSRVFDLLFWWQAGLQGPFYHIPKTLGAFRTHSESQTAQGGMISARETIRLVDTFYSDNQLPLEIINVKKKAYSNAYFIAALYASRDEHTRFNTLKYLGKSVLFSPINFISFRWKERRNLIISSILGKKFISKLKSFTYKIDTVDFGSNIK